MAVAAYIPILPHFEGRKGALLEMRFWSKVAMGDPEVCWDWKSPTTAKGYGRMKIAAHISATANRIAWTLSNRRDPGELVVRHTCDRPICCNPAHLLLGTIADNNNDKMERGRHRTGDQRGEANGRAILSEADVAGIIDRLRARQNNAQIAAQFGISDSLVSRIRYGLSWRETAMRLGWMPLPRPRAKGEAA